MAVRAPLDGLNPVLVRLNALGSSLPASSDLHFEATLSPELSSSLDASQQQALDLIQALVGWCDTAAPRGRNKLKKRATEVDDEAIKEGDYTAIADAVEYLLEGADTALDAARKPRASTSSALPIPPRSLGTQAASKIPKLPESAPKPQLLFNEQVKNPKVDDGEQLWKPLLKSKPLAPKETEKDWLRVEHVAERDRGEVDTEEPGAKRPRYAHPFAKEQARADPPAAYFAVPSNLPARLEARADVPLVKIETAEGVQQLVEQLRTDESKELAIDLEYHDYRSWAGLTCLMQMSTRTTDYLIDVLVPEVRSTLHALNEFFTSPSWIKVFHGSHSDIIWLQKDLGLYIIGLFDTYDAGKILGLPQLSLAYLLAEFAGIEADKRFQLADWRVRPMTEEMEKYARADTHYLLGIYDLLRARLLAHTPPDELDRPKSDEWLRESWAQSKKTAGSVYRYPVYDFEGGTGDNGWRSFLRKHRLEAAFRSSAGVAESGLVVGTWGRGGRSFEIMRRLHRWREGAARELDESTRYILSNASLLALVEAAPEDAVSLFKVLNEASVASAIGSSKKKKTQHVGEIVRKRKAEVLEAIKEGKEAYEQARLSTATVPPKAAAQAVKAAATLPTAIKPVAFAPPVAEGGLGVRPFFDAASWNSPAAALPALSLRKASSSLFGSTPASKAVVQAQQASGLVMQTSGMWGGAMAVAKSGKVRARADGSSVDEEARRKKVRLLEEGLMGASALGVSLKNGAVPQGVLQQQQQDTAQEPARSTNHVFVAPPKKEEESEKPKNRELEDDVIIVSERSKGGNKKLKTNKRPSPSDEGDARTLGIFASTSSSNKKPKKSRPAAEAFDPSSRTSLLDGAVPEGGMKKRLQKKEKKESEVNMEVKSAAYGRPINRTAPNKGNLGQSFDR